MADTIVPAGKGAAQAPLDPAMLTDAETEAASGGGLQEIWEAAKMILRGSARGDFFGDDKARDILKPKPSPLRTDDAGPLALTRGSDWPRTARSAVPARRGCARQSGAFQAWTRSDI